jgi:cytochrome b561
MSDHGMRWNVTSRLLHWLTVVLIIVQVSLGLAERYLLRSGPPLSVVIGYHESIGMTILGLTAIRLLWRWTNPVPAPPITFKNYERMLARFTHAALYAILLAMPLSGWIGLSANGDTVLWFQVFAVPGPVGKDLPLSRLMIEMHEVLAVILGMVVMFHVAAAVRHHFILGDDTLRRMFP